LLSKVGLLFSIDLIAAAYGSYLGKDIQSFWALIGLVVLSFVLLFAVKIVEQANKFAGILLAAGFALTVGLWSGPALLHWSHVLGWQTVAFSFLGTCLAMTVFGGIGAFSGRDFSSWGPFLFQALLGLLIFRIILMFLPTMSGTSILSGLAGVVLFSGYFIYDFYRAAHDANTWENAIDHSIEIFLDFVNFLFSLLQLESKGK
jgi:FtsH-binding integral membrane protein